MIVKNIQDRTALSLQKLTPGEVIGYMAIDFSLHEIPPM